MCVLSSHVVGVAAPIIAMTKAQRIIVEAICVFIIFCASPLFGLGVGAVVLIAEMNSEL